MDKVVIKPRHGLAIVVTEDENGLHIGTRSDPSEYSQGGCLEHEGVQKLIDACQQWLEEHPVKVEGWLSIHASGYTEILPEKDTKQRGSLTERIAIKPFSYHIGEGLNDSGDESD